jgi:hypothetical protein
LGLPNRFRIRRKEVEMKTPVTIRYVSGREEKFEIELWGGSGAAGRLAAFVKEPNLILRTATELVIIPGSAIECISIALPKTGDMSLKLDDFRPARRLP